MLINCAAYVNGVSQGNLDIEAISDFLGAAHPPGSFVWVALLEPVPAMLEKMQEEFGLHELAIEDTNRGSQRPKLEEYGGTLFLIVHTIERSGNEFIDGELHIYASDKFVLTVRHRATSDFKKVRVELERDPAFMALGSATAVHALIDEVVDRFFPLLADLEERLDELEEVIFANTTDRRAAAEKLYALKRDTMCLRRAVTPLQEVCQRLVGHKHVMIRDELRPYFRDVLDHVTRIDESLDNLRDMENSAAQTNLALITLQESETTKRLAGWGAIFMVPTIIGSIYGMNFKHMPELEWAYGYPFALSLMFGASVVLWWFFRRIRWV